jgi:hypothetical protein
MPSDMPAAARRAPARSRPVRRVLCSTRRSDLDVADVPPDLLVEPTTQAWLDRAPARLARAFLDGRG